MPVQASVGQRSSLLESCAHVHDECAGWKCCTRKAGLLEMHMQGSPGCHLMPLARPLLQARGCAQAGACVQPLAAAPGLSSQCARGPP